MASTGREPLSPLLTELVGNMTFDLHRSRVPGLGGAALVVSCLRAVPCPCHMAPGGSGWPLHLPQHRLTWPSSSSLLGGVLALALCPRTAWVWEVLPLDLCWGFQVSLCHFSVSASLHSVVPLGKRRVGHTCWPDFFCPAIHLPGGNECRAVPCWRKKEPWEEE